MQLYVCWYVWWKTADQNLLCYLQPIYLCFSCFSIAEMKTKKKKKTEPNQTNNKKLKKQIRKILEKKGEYAFHSHEA